MKKRSKPKQKFKPGDTCWDFWENRKDSNELLECEVLAVNYQTSKHWETGEKYWVVFYQVKSSGRLEHGIQKHLGKTKAEAAVLARKDARWHIKYHKQELVKAIRESQRLAAIQKGVDHGKAK